jgi:nucleotide-binding universal stress UspA family protein
MVPVDLSHKDHLGKALAAAGGLAKIFSAPVCYVGVTTNTPSEVAHTPAEFARKLEAFAAEQAAEHGITATSKAYTSHDPTIDLDDYLAKAVPETGADLVIMASHLPGMLEHVWSSHAGWLASHSKVSVFIVR